VDTNVLDAAGAVVAIPSFDFRGVGIGAHFPFRQLP
jgi:hypothetical protein